MLFHLLPCILHICINYVGQFGTVYKAEMKTTQPSASAFFKTVAIKTIPQITLDFRNEVTIMSEVVHPNIVHLYGLIVEGIYKLQFILCS